jgi:hypothetical protein
MRRLLSPVSSDIAGHGEVDVIATPSNFQIKAAKFPGSIGCDLLTAENAKIAKREKAMLLWDLCDLCSSLEGCWI